MGKKIVMEIADYEKIVKYLMRINVGFEALEEAAEVKRILQNARAYDVNIIDNKNGHGNS